jgi:hypothetical protein
LVRFADGDLEGGSGAVAAAAEAEAAIATAATSTTAIASSPDAPTSPSSSSSSSSTNPTTPTPTITNGYVKENKSLTVERNAAKGGSVDPMTRHRIRKDLHRTCCNDVFGKLQGLEDPRTGLLYR